MEELIMFVKYSGDGREEAYAFGPDWVGMALFMDDMGAESEDAAVLEWYYKIFKKRNSGEYYIPTKQDFDVEIWMSMHPGDESAAILDWYNNVYKKEWLKANANEGEDTETAEDNS